jgi:hypothetical protein
VGNKSLSSSSSSSSSSSFPSFSSSYSPSLSTSFHPDTTPLVFASKVLLREEDDHQKQNFPHFSSLPSEINNHQKQTFPSSSSSLGPSEIQKEIINPYVIDANPCQKPTHFISEGLTTGIVDGCVKQMYRFLQLCMEV